MSPPCLIRRSYVEMLLGINAPSRDVEHVHAMSLENGRDADSVVHDPTWLLWSNLFDSFAAGNPRKRRVRPVIVGGVA